MKDFVRLIDVVWFDMQNEREMVGLYSKCWRYWYCILVLLLNLFCCFFPAAAFSFTLVSFWKSPLDNFWIAGTYMIFVLIISFSFMLQNLFFLLIFAWKLLLFPNKYIHEIISPFLITTSKPFCNEIGSFLSKVKLNDVDEHYLTKWENK